MVEKVARVAHKFRKIQRKACLHYQTNKQQRNKYSDTGDAEETGARHIWAENLQKGNLNLHFKSCLKEKVNWGILKSRCNFGTQPWSSKLRFNWISCSKATLKLIGVKVM